MKGALKVLKTSFVSSFQDRGRFGFGDIGITQSGAMDELSFCFLNKLLGNQFNTSAIEINLGGVEFEVLGETDIAFCGAQTNISINGLKAPLWKSLHVKQNDKIKIDFASKGNFIYLGVKGGFKTKTILNSHSHSQKENIGNALKVGDMLEFTCKKSYESRYLKDEFIPRFKDEIILHVIPSYQYDDFSDEQKEQFFSNIYETTPQSNRMGFRLSGEPLKDVKKGIISEGICFGAVQIPPHGEPIVLLKERQSIGGYPKIGAILPIDCFTLAQSKPKTKIGFEEISLEKASKKMKEFYQNFTKSY